MVVVAAAAAVGSIAVRGGGKHGRENGRITSRPSFSIDSYSSSPYSRSSPVGTEGVMPSKGLSPRADDSSRSRAGVWWWRMLW